MDEKRPIVSLLAVSLGYSVCNGQHALDHTYLNQCNQLAGIFDRLFYGFLHEQFRTFRILDNLFLLISYLHWFSSHSIHTKPLLNYLPFIQYH
ncbi:hypothetical protein BJ138DRAFT_305917 [Hygrophoropsis aurantiaca]|uniref:Uncharacterized protein n=1 Tax=Hygrophoropsis aurantiaca TaxID=72124 RepID=A0ACB8A836_9AGAM|nr:hypothetical protein BJ138DRAFT_305917 [Hygrophoropsis aurantiaca]